MSKITAEQKKLWEEITSEDFRSQAIWWLNGYWDGDCGEPVAENIWTWVQSMVEILEGKIASNIDEFASHRFLEGLGETMTVIAFREKMRTIDLDFDKRMSLIEYLIFRYGKDVTEVIHLPQGSNKEELEKAEGMVKASQTAVEEMLEKLEKMREMEKPFLEAEEKAKQAQQENEKALNELHAQEEAYHGKIKKLEHDIETLTGVVKKNRAKQELAQIKAEDPLPLRRAKLNQGAAVRKAKKATKKAEEARKPFAEATAAANQSVEAANESVKEAMDYLDEIKRKGGVAKGDIWWMEREIEEKRKFLPKGKKA